MAELYFKVGSDWQEVVRLREEIEKLEKQLLKMDKSKTPAAVSALEIQLGSAKQKMTEMVSEAAKAGATMENDFKKRIFEASQGVNDFSQKIIEQKRVIKDIEHDMRGLSERYRKYQGTFRGDTALADYNSAKKALQEERNALFDLTQQQAEARLSVKRLRDEYSLYKDDAKNVTTANDGIGISLKKAFAVLGGVAVVKSLVSNIVRVRGEFQLMDTAIQTLLGSKEKADKLMVQVKEYAKISPLELKDVSEATQMMLGFSIEAEKVPRFLRAIGGISMGESGKFKSLTLAFSQMSAAGKLMGQDLNQMIDAGFNPLKIMSEKTGKSIAQLKDEMSKGAISTEMVQQAFINATEAGGKFYNMSENASKTINGQLSMMRDALDSVYNEIGEKSEGVIATAIQSVTTLIQNYETIGKVLVGLVATYGVYRAAVLLAIQAENGHSLAMVAARARILATQKVQALLNATMLKNPYVLAAVALGTLVTAMWAMRDSTTAAEKAQKTLSDQLQKAKEKKENLISRTNELINKINDETSSIYAQIKAWKELQKELPEAFAGMTIDEFRNMNPEEIKKKVNVAIDEREIKDINDKYIDQKKIVEEIAKQIRSAEHSSKSRTALGKKNIGDLNEKYKYEFDILAGIKRQLDDIEAIEAESKPKEDRLRILQEEKAELEAQRKVIINAHPEIQRILDGTVDIKDNYVEIKDNVFDMNSAWGKFDAQTALNLSNIISFDNKIADISAKIFGITNDDKPVVKNKAHWEKIKKDAETSRDALDSTADVNSAKWKELTKTIANAQKELDKYGAPSKQESQAEKLRQQNEKYRVLVEKQKLEQIRAEEDLQMQVDQARIDAMDEGSAKYIAQRELNFEKELQAIDRQKEDVLRKKIEDARAAFEAKPGNKGKIFDASGITLSKEEIAGFDSMYKSALDKQDQLDKELAKKYQDYADQRLAIEKKYNDDIAILQQQRRAAEESGNREHVDQLSRSIAQATKEKGQSLISFNFELLKKSPEYVKAYQNLKKASTQTLKSLISQFKDVERAAGVAMDPKQLMEYMNAFQGMIDEVESRNPFSKLIQKKKELVKVNEKLKASEEILQNVISGKNTSISKESAEEKRNKARERAIELGHEIIEIEKTISSQAKEVLNELRGLGDILGGTLGDIVNTIADIGDSMISASDGLSKLKDSESGFMSKAQGALAIISAAIAINKEIGKLIPNSDEQYQKFASKVDEINKLSDAVNEYEIAVIKARQAEENWFATNNLRNLKQAKELNKIVGGAYFDKLKEEQAIYQNQSGGGWLTDILKPYIWFWDNTYGHLYGDIAKDYAEGMTAAFTNLRIETRKKSSGFLGSGIGGKSQKTEDLQTWINDNKDKFKGLNTKLFDEKGFLNKELAQNVLDNFGNKLVGQTKETLEALLKLQEQYDEYLEQLHEYVSSLYEPIVDNFVDSLWDWFDEGKDALDSFKDYASQTFRDIVSDMMRTIILEKVIGKFDEDIADFYEQYASGKITEEELMQEVAKRTGKLIDDYEENLPAIQGIMKTVTDGLEGIGIDLKNKEGTSQDSTKRGFELMTQDQSGELIGRFTALGMVGEEIKQQNTEQTQSLTEMKGSIDLTNITLGSLHNIADESRTILVNSFIELQGIRENTEAVIKPINQMNDKLDKIEQNTRDL